MHALQIKRVNTLEITGETPFGNAEEDDGDWGHLAEVMEAPLGGEGDDHDEGADPRDDPRRRVLQRVLLQLPALHNPGHPPSAGRRSASPSGHLLAKRRRDVVGRRASPQGGGGGGVARSRSAVWAWSVRTPERVDPGVPIGKGKKLNPIRPASVRCNVGQFTHCTA